MTSIKALKDTIDVLSFKVKERINAIIQYCNNNLYLDTFDGDTNVYAELEKYLVEQNEFEHILNLYAELMKHINFGTGDIFEKLEWKLSFNKWIFHGDDVRRTGKTEDEINTFATDSYNIITGLHTLFLEFVQVYSKYITHLQDYRKTELAELAKSAKVLDSISTVARKTVAIQKSFSANRTRADTQFAQSLAKFNSIARVHATINKKLDELDTRTLDINRTLGVMQSNATKSAIDADTLAYIKNGQLTGNYNPGTKVFHINIST